MFTGNEAAIRKRLRDARHPWPHADPDADGSPKQRREHGHRHYTKQRQHGKPHHMQHLGAGHLGLDFLGDADRVEDKPRYARSQREPDHHA
jgi:hypothetical protein